MKKITVIIISTLICLFATRVFAYTDLSTIPSLPYTINSVAYNDVVYSDRIVIFFNRNQVNITIVPDIYGDFYEITDNNNQSRIYYYSCNPPGDPIRSNCTASGYAGDILPRYNGTYGTGFYTSISFRDAVTDGFRTTSGGGDECVLYVRAETDIPYAACNGEAGDCFSQAQSQGYVSSSTPRVGAIMVFSKVPNTGLQYGHVGIVTAISGTNVTIQDSNWYGDHIIHNHTVDTTNYGIEGYIYPKP